MRNGCGVGSSGTERFPWLSGGNNALWLTSLITSIKIFCDVHDHIHAL